METLRWSNRFSVGNEDIDQQHKMLFNFINYLVLNSGKACKRHEMTEILEELIAYTDYHFTAEEVFLEGHPTFAAHRAAHAEFIGKTRSFKKAFMEKNEEINGDLFAYLVKWIREHVLETDCLFFQEQAQTTPRANHE
jgi:hemerythrin